MNTEEKIERAITAGFEPERAERLRKAIKKAEQLQDYYEDATEEHRKDELYAQRGW